MIVMFGSRGCARDAFWLWHESNTGEAGLDAFVAADGAEEIGANIRDVPIIAEADLLARHAESVRAAYIGIGVSAMRARVLAKIRPRLAAARYPTLIHPSVRYDRRPSAFSAGEGVMVCAGTTLTTEVRLADFVHVNLHCTVAHCTEIGAFSTLSPGCLIAGNVVIGQRCFFGAGAVVNENLRIVDDVVVGSGATVVKDILEPGTYVGTPARRLLK